MSPDGHSIKMNLAWGGAVLDPAVCADAPQVIAGTNKDLFWIEQILVAANPLSVQS
jgi:hypothetical protein